MGLPRIARVFGAVNIGSFRVSAMIMGQSETGEMVVLGASHRQSQGVRRGYITDMAAATYAIRAAVERAEDNADTRISSVWVGAAGGGLSSRIARVEVPVGGRRIEDEDIAHLLYSAREAIEPDGRMVLHAQPASYILDGAHGATEPRGLYAERLGVDIHIMLAETAPVCNLREAVERAHLTVEGVVASPVAASYACLTQEERELGTVLIEIGGDVVNVGLFSGGLLQALHTVRMGSGDITDAIASAFGIRRTQAERLKNLAGSAIASPTDHREMVPVNPPGEDAAEGDKVNRAELVSVITESLGQMFGEIGRILRHDTFAKTKGQVVITGGGAQLAGIAEFAQGALGRQVRIGRAPELRGMPDAMANPGFATLAGLCLYAEADPIDVRKVSGNFTETTRYGGLALARRLWHAARDYF
ncbi:cell division protein FtsA [Erythrobacter sp. LQ02-29]|uniref:cell division protein FtsA n=1 Tax=unclassified Erythrobacter TaxID=2633097 RepID=UPI001BFC0D80|nr:MULTISPECIES: cell division protein FtsA [unclassified Erythrobacter]MCP9222539.1 cell division protein FtsA [Erythrobacter sp. LQ02-29]QWC56183.1 cell division protein FtsA [Erythrobacter sp. 3-20A1M]